MEFLIYLVLPCVGSVFLLGMFYAAYRMSGPESMPRKEGMPVRKDMPRKEGMSVRKDMLRKEGMPVRKDMLRKEGMPVRKDIPRKEGMSVRKDMLRKEGMSVRKGMPREKGMQVRKDVSWEESMPGWKDMPRHRRLLRQKSTSGQKDMLRRKGISGRALWIITAYTLVCVAFSMLGNTWVNLAFLFLFPLAAWRAFETPKAYCLYYFILFAAVWLTDVAVVLGLQIAMAEGLLYLNSPELQYILIVAVTRMAEFMVILLVALAAGRKAGRHITVRQVAISVLFPLYSIFNVYCLLYLMQIYPSREMVLLFGVNLVLLIGLNLYFCVLVDVMSENYRLENERNLYQVQARMQHQYYEREEEKYEASRKMIHDIRNHIQVMEALYARGTCRGRCPEGCPEETRRNGREDTWGDVLGKAGTGRDIQRAEKYAGDIHRMLNSLQQKYYTSEKLLNIILNDKAGTMQRLGVREDMKVGELSLDFMKETDVTALFANLLDNAVAAAANSREGYVRLRINRVRQFLSVTVENSCDTEPVKAAGTFRSRQAGHEGLGLKIIRQTVEQYGGDMQMGWKEGVFTVRVMLAAEMAE